jgi:hypothetical protein
VQYRSDFPHTDNDNWCVNTVFSNKDGEPMLSMEDPVITRVQPPKGKMSFNQAVESATASLKRRGV